MAAVASTLTFTAGQFRYIEVDGTEHTVTTSQTLSLSIDDNSSTDVRYSFKSGQTATTTDGVQVEVCARAEQGQVGSNSNVNRTLGVFADTQDGTTMLSVPGEFIMVGPYSKHRTHWRVAQITPSNVDYNAAGTITMILEDVFGHRMSIPFQLISTVSVAQAA